MPKRILDTKGLGHRVTLFAASAALLGGLLACNHSEKTGAAKPVQKTFASPEEAGTALLDAAKSGDRNALVSIFGADADQVIMSGDTVKDKDNFLGFAAAYSQMHRWREIKSGGEMLYVGADNYTFPIPIGKNQAGQWYFDTAAGKDEILARRLGKDELAAIAACEALAAAEQQYFSQPRGVDRVKEYAQKLVSDDGKQNGLYWQVSAGETPSPLEDLRDFAKALGYANAGSNPQPFAGYYFRILTKQGDKAKGGAKDYINSGKMTGGFAVLAYPVAYRNSGIMTFIVGADGVVYQKDLGENTPTIAQEITEYNPADSWKPAI